MPKIIRVKCCKQCPNVRIARDQYVCAMLGGKTVQNPDAIDQNCELEDDK